MIRIFKHYVPKSILVLGAVDAVVLFVAHYAGYYLRLVPIGLSPTSFDQRLGDAAHFVVVLTIMMLALGLYQRDACRDLRVSFTRLVVVFLLSFMWFAMVFYLYPRISEWRSIFIISYSLAFTGLFLSRVLFGRVVDLSPLKQRILVLGAGEGGQKICQLEADGLTHGFVVIGVLRMNSNETTVAEAGDYSTIDSLLDFARAESIDEIVTAAEERRGSLPVRDLLACKLNGIAITEFSAFVERETGFVELDTLTLGWLVYSDGFSGGRLDTIVKRLFDIVTSLALLLFTLPILVAATVAVAISSRGPVLYRQRRVGQHGESFMLLKFRSMKVDAETDGIPKWAERNDPRITKVGHILRMTRIDELPQIFNVLRGDMSFVGPRPERPYFVESLSRELPYYSERHEVKPGITGWAQLNYPYGASVEDAKKKLQYDLYYIKNCSIFIDFLILVQTVRVILFPEGSR